MSIVALFGAIETGLLYALIGLGVYLSFRVLEFPDLTVDGSFPLGGAVAATLILQGVNPAIATFIACLAGALAGLVTAWLNVQLKILHLLASILTMISLYSINLRIMGKPNIALLGQPTILTPLQPVFKSIPQWLVIPIILLAIVIIIKILLDQFLNSEIGLAMRATGANPLMAKAQGITTERMILLGMAISNGLVALGGALFAQIYGFADVTMGVGTIVFGLAAVIIGETFIAPTTVMKATLGAILGSVVYRIAVALALNADFLGFQAQDLNLVTAILVALALVLPQSRNRLGTFLKR
ncbi:ABC transporter permease [Planktothrix mougeotii]|uniref:ABC transporter permease n=1 Tax=Planktothrix mougeotii LEGE 06226 TaxID=1828728 RepID=A0ABR9UII1_9CYAN|nr:ABC transporter permease [Planktothrix mougeotii]MBE9146268.1 ABC transporter permease [Planktothrix mougeotii LEGE 06226]